ncbi:Aldo/keto reductase [Coemansia reversa NRRL 1564]|uniref:Aldo/keto reductase n=1 Tax=Coemansia reversa (strain ATCC 12441 / NRRL 1564) TaxID=763665 RepID=A0A2G5BGS0_COERN|nr:Aldo/keto reductase [Coemansia reversa NRRL 1564]|eukprot:PIA18191.1 Aldo/keto reductase [Coemansia reversa NRRL 1564]
MPSIGLGTWQQRDHATITRVVQQALRVGYRLIDTASGYRNEEAIGEALQATFACKNANLCRNDIWLTSKLGPKQQGFEGASTAIQESLQKLQTDYIDLYLIHWPGIPKKSQESEDHRIYREKSWKALETFYKRGVVRAIGVSNYTVKHLEEMKDYADIPPMVNQCEMHPLCPQTELLQYCHKNNIVFTAYASLGESALLNPCNIAPDLHMIAARRPDLTLAQILLIWGLQHNAAVIPKASTIEHLQENLAANDHKLSTNEMLALDGVEKKYHRHFCWDPQNVA